MMKLHLSLRLTHRYVGSYDHLDKWRDLPDPVRVTESRMVAEGNDLDAGGTYIRWATLPGQLSRKKRDEMVRGLEQTLTKWGCAHEWDCCGCPSFSTRAIHRKGRNVVLRTTVTYNY